MSQPAPAENFFLDPLAWDAPLAPAIPVGAARYREFTPLGVGGKAEVYLCLDETLGRRVAYKVLRHDLAGRPEEERRLVREARLMAKFAHPAIPEVYEIGRDVNCRPYFTMRASRGVTLQWLLDAMRCGDAAVRHEFTLERRVHAMEQAARALGYAHHCGVVHADLKPGNLLIEDFEKIALIDWGLAELAAGRAPRSARSRREGTPLHMPPEQIAGEGDAGDRRSDVYRLGSVLYECLTLAPMASGADVKQVLAQAMHETPIPPRERNPHAGITLALEQVCLRAVAKNPLARFPDAAELAAALYECLLDLLVYYERDPDSRPERCTDSRAAGHSANEASGAEPSAPSPAELDAWWTIHPTDSF